VFPFFGIVVEPEGSAGQLMPKTEDVSARNLADIAGRNLAFSAKIALRNPADRHARCRLLMAYALPLPMAWLPSAKSCAWVRLQQSPSHGGTRH
jgi:hypothetical protein